MSFSVVNGRRPRGAPENLGDIGNVRLLIWGQSNADGRAEQSDLATSPLSGDPDLADYMDGTLPLSRVSIYTGSAFATLTDGNNEAPAGQFGPEFGFAVRWMSATTGGNVYVEKEGLSGQPISTFDPDGFTYPGFVTRHNSASSWLTSNAIDIDIEVWVWIQGESDTATSEATYQAALEELMAATDADSITSAATMRVLAQMKVGSSGYSSSVAAAKTAIAAANPTKVKTVQMDYYKGDNLHCNGRGQVQLGYDIFERALGAAHVSA